jgi:hypothetical protein
MSGLVIGCPRPLNIQAAKHVQEKATKGHTKTRPIKVSSFSKRKWRLWIDQNPGTLGIVSGGSERPRGSRAKDPPCPSVRALALQTHVDMRRRRIQSCLRRTP